ncbi:MAG TPA: hypothetical protein VNZ52_00865, partial [Candidatus Thermoplasmatota archaeon]|nr:hypothetical protein [Candidatus Thermoplasmatota archaeon]
MTLFSSRLASPAALVGALLFLPLTGAGLPATAEAEPLAIQEFLIPEDRMCELRNQWVDHLLSTYPEGTWAPMRWNLEDEQLALMGLPPKAVLTSMRFSEPTMVSADGAVEIIDRDVFLQAAGTMGPTAAAYGGTGCLGIRPGAWLLLIDNLGVGWCSFAHVHGSPGSYSISTAGHCGGVGTVATVIAGFGNRAGVLNPILLDVGKFTKSTGDGGIGKDWALVGIDAPWQGLVSPTMCFWGGPQGVYTKQGYTVSATLLGRKLIDGPYVNPDPFLVQGIVHYGHGTGVGAGGTPRAGTAFWWGANHFAWEGVISPGDSGSGSNTITGDSVGAVREAAGINTHIFVDASLKTGVGFMASTRTTLVGTPANGQLVPYP